MATFLSTTSINFYLEQLIKKSSNNLILISPYLQINERLKELLQHKSQSGVVVKIIYGKKEMSPKELEWFNHQQNIKLFFCKNLHAKCYINDSNAIITSLNLYEFSQVNNNEMGVLLTKVNDQEAFKEAYDEANRLLNLSEPVSLFSSGAHHSLDLTQSILVEDTDEIEESDTLSSSAKLTTAKLAQHHNIKTQDMTTQLTNLGYLEIRDGYHYLTDKGKQNNGEYRKGRAGFYFLWPETLPL